MNTTAHDSRFTVKTLACWVGVAAFGASIVTALVSQVPILGKLNGPWDRELALAYAISCLAVVTLAWFGNGRCLAALVFAGVLGALLTSSILGIAGTSIVKLGLITLLAAGVGGRWIRTVDFEYDFDRLLVSTVLGYGALSGLVLLLLLCQVFTLPWVLLSLTATAVVVRKDILWSVKALCKPERPMVDAENIRLVRLCGAAVVVGFFSSYLWALAPATGSDELHYHLGVPLLYIHHGGWFDVPETAASFFCHNAEMLYALGLLVHGQPLPTLFHLLFALLTTGLVVMIGREVGGLRAGMIAAVLFAGLPVVSLYSGWAMNDLVVCCFFAAAIYSLLRWLEAAAPAGRGHLLLGAVFAGLAVSTKLSAGVAMLPVAPLLLFGFARRRIRFADQVKSTATFGLLALLICSPWLILAWWYTGSPVFPLFNGIFKSPRWSTMENDLENLHAFGNGRSLIDFLRLPWDLTFNSEAFGEIAYLAFGGIAVAAIPWTGLKREGGRLHLVVAAYLLLGAASFFPLTFNYRYVLPLAILAVVLAALNVENTLRLFHASRWRTPLACLLCAVLGVWLFFTRCTNLVHNYFIPERLPTRLALGKESEDEFLRRTVWEYEVLDFIAHGLEEDAPKILDSGLSTRFYSGKARIYVPRLSNLLTEMLTAQTEAQLYEVLRRKEFEYVLMDPARRCLGRHLDRLMNEDFLDKYCELVFARHDTCLYRLVQLGAKPSTPSTTALQKNGGFEGGSDDGGVPEWSTGGSPSRLRLNETDQAENHVARVGFNDYYFQDVPVSPEKLYLFQYRCRADKDASLTIMRIDWLDDAGNLITNDLVEQTISQDWRTVRLRTSPPPGCRRGRIYAWAYVTGDVLVDDVEFLELSEPLLLARKTSALR